MPTQREITYSTFETAELTGASIKQIYYWIERGYVQSDRNVCGLVAYYRFTPCQIELIRSIKMFLIQGYTLARAAELAMSENRNSD